MTAWEKEYPDVTVVRQVARLQADGLQASSAVMPAVGSAAATSAVTPSGTRWSAP
jgi:hypothetical protein